MSPDKRYQGNVDPSIQICAGHEEGGGDACQGDSGGPLIVIENGSPKMVGIMSWGIGCGRAHFYTVYTRISTFIPWMEKTISDMRVQWLLNENPILTTPAPTIGTTLHEAGQYLRLIKISIWIRQPRHNKVIVPSLAEIKISFRINKHGNQNSDVEVHMIKLNICSICAYLNKYWLKYHIKICL